MQIGHDASGNILITGDGNVVVVHATKRLETDVPITPSRNLGPNPYKGLAAFQETEGNLFFGRERLIQNLWERFRKLHESQPNSVQSIRILPVLGPSGSGKSSVVRAGLIPELARQPLPGRNSSRVAVFSPGAHPLEALSSVLAHIVTRDDIPVAKSRELVEELNIKNARGGYDGLRRIAASIPGINESRLVIFVDQFEEIYSQCEDENQVQVFTDNLLEAAIDGSQHVSVILTLRTDFIGETVRYESFNRVISEQGVIVPIMNPEELRRAIAEPANRSGHPLDDALVDLLISQTKNREGVLPLLQFALTRVWEGITRNIEPIETLREIGGVGGALAVEAQRLYDDLESENDKEIARRAFIKLVRIGADIPTTRRTLSIADIVAHDEDIRHIKNVLARFAAPGARIITLSAEDNGSEIAKISHEALIEHWQQLKKWIADAYDNLLFQYRLEDAARYWDTQERPSGLLWRPPDLYKLREFRKIENSDLTELQIAFSEASEKAFFRERIFKIGSAVSSVILISVVLIVWYAPFTPPIVPPTVDLDDIFKEPTMTPERIEALEKINSEVKEAADFLNRKLNQDLNLTAKLLEDNNRNTYWDGEKYVRAPASAQYFPEMIYHETAHPFINKLAPNLGYKGQTGALVESYADIYSQLVEQAKLGQTAGDADWVLAPGSVAWYKGEDITTTTDKRPLGSLKEPGTAYDDPFIGKDPQKKHMNDYVDTDKDMGGVHIYKGIPNKAFYETAIKIGSDKAGEIWTRALPKLKSAAQFQDLANNTYKAAGELYGSNSTEQKAVKAAWLAVGISIR